MPVGTPVILRVKRLAFPSYEHFIALIKANEGKVESAEIACVRQRETYMLDIGTNVVVVSFNQALNMTRVCLSDGRECDISPIIDGEQDLE